MGEIKKKIPRITWKLGGKKNAWEEECVCFIGLTHAITGVKDN